MATQFRKEIEIEWYRLRNQAPLSTVTVQDTIRGRDTIITLEQSRVRIGDRVDRALNFLDTIKAGTASKRMLAELKKSVEEKIAATDELIEALLHDEIPEMVAARLQNETIDDMDNILHKWILRRLKVDIPLKQVDGYIALQVPLPKLSAITKREESIEITMYLRGPKVSLENNTRYTLLKAALEIETLERARDNLVSRLKGL